MTYVGLNVLAGRVGELRGVEFGLLNMETRCMAGAQFGLVSVVAGDVLGLQYSLANWAGSSVFGLQQGLFNHAGGDIVGLQAGIWNDGSGQLRGLQNGLVDLAGDVQGVQFGLYNQAPHVAGVQAGLVNFAREASSVQVGLVNVGGSVTVPVGIVNVADDAEAPVGLVNWVKGGYRAVGLWSSDIALTNVGVKLGGRWAYGLIAAGTQPLRSQKRHFATLGLGVHLPAGSWFLDLDATSSMVFTNAGFQDGLLPVALRLVAIREIGRGVSLTAGLTWNVVIGEDGVDADLAVLPQVVQKDGGATVRQFPGFVLGLQI